MYYESFKFQTASLMRTLRINAAQQFIFRLINARFRRAGRETGQCKGTEYTAWRAHLIVQDKGAFQVPVSYGGEANTVWAAAFAPNQWYHIYMAACGNAYDVYVNGVKLNDSPLPFIDNSGTLITDTGIEGINLMMYSTAWNTETFWDDVIVQKMSSLQLNSHSLEQGINDVPLYTKTIEINFNNIIDVSTLKNIKLTEGPAASEKPISVQLVAEYPTKVSVPLTENLNYETDYRLGFDGLSDIFATSAIGQTLDFRTTAPSADASIVSSISEQGSLVPLNSELTPMLTFDQELNPSTVIPENFTVTAKNAASHAQIKVKTPSFQTATKLLLLHLTVIYFQTKNIPLF